MEYKILKVNGEEIDFDEFTHVVYYLSGYLGVSVDILLGYKDRIIELNQYIRNAGLQVIDMKKQIPL